MTTPEATPLMLPSDPKARKAIPMAGGLLDYFPAALAAVAELSKAGNDKHNPGQPLHHARGKSSDHADCIVRHLIDRGTVDPEDGLRHSAKVAWRALALLQEELEAAGAPLARGAKSGKTEEILQRYPDSTPPYTARLLTTITRASNSGGPYAPGGPCAPVTSSSLSSSFPLALQYPFAPAPRPTGSGWARSLLSLVRSLSRKFGSCLRRMLRKS